MHVRHIRSGVELKPIMSDDHYDFNYQSTIMFPRPVIIMPNDEIIFECVYDTSNRGDITIVSICFGILLR